VARGWLAIAIVVLVVAGCVGEAASSSPLTSVPGTAAPTGTSVSIVPWSWATPAPFVTPPATPVPSGATCRADQLRIGGASWIGPSESMESMMGSFSIWNVSGEPCLLEGTPTVAVLDARRHDLHVRNTPFSDFRAQPIVLPAHETGAAAFLETRPTGMGYVLTQWWSLCATAVAKGPLELVVMLPQGGALRTPVGSGSSGSTGSYGSIPPCVAAEGSSFAVGPFQQVPPPAPTEPPAIPAESLRLALEVLRPRLRRRAVGRSTARACCRASLL
jgi:hypothetical protein